jgi:hypothetical protein
MVTSVNDIPAGDGKMVNHFLQCRLYISKQCQYPEESSGGSVSFIAATGSNRLPAYCRVYCTPCSLAINMSHKMFSSIHYKHTAKTFLPFREYLFLPDILSYLILLKFWHCRDIINCEKLSAYSPYKFNAVPFRPEHKILNCDWMIR